MNSNRCALAVAALLACVSALAQETSLQPLELPASVRRLPTVAESPAGPQTGPTVADDTEEVVVQGRSMPFLREQLELAEQRLFSVYNDLNTIDEFDIRCRFHAQTGTRMLQRRCLPNFVAALDERQAKAGHRALTGESFYDLDWQSANGEIFFRGAELREHMQRLALEHPELLDAMRDVYGLMRAVYPNRYGSEDENEDENKR